jgi:uncharacterized protein (TIGR02611 family)
MRTIAHLTLRHSWRVFIAIVGGAVLLVGLALVVLPGPALLVLPLGLAILASEFTWARNLLDAVTRRIRRLRHAVTRKRRAAARAARIAAQQPQERAPSRDCILAVAAAAGALRR